MAQAKTYFGLSCPNGGDFYICEGAAKEFIGCCMSDPCGTGECPTGELRSATFNRDRYAKLLTQDCDDPRGINIWYTCAGIRPPFMGCCDENPCAGGGCPRISLVPALLSSDDDLRQDFLYPDGGDDEGNSTTKATATGTGSSATATSTSDSDSNGGGLSTGAVAGIAVGATLLGLLILGFLVWKFWWVPRKAKQGDPMTQVRPNEYQPQPHTPGTGTFPQQSPNSHYSLASSPTMTYYPSGTQDAAKYGGAGGWTPSQSTFDRPMSYAYTDVSGMTPQIGHMTPHQQTGYGVAPVAPIHSPQEMDASMTVVQELGTGEDPPRVAPSQASPGIVDSPTMKPDNLGIRP